jgi:ABC-type lipoprotein release transport system permease subunit
MTRIPVFFKIAMKYLWRYRRRYLFLFLALGFGFGVVTVISSLKDSMEENLYLSAQSHYAGDILALGYDGNSFISQHMTRKEIDAIFSAAEAAGLDTAGAAVRTLVQAKAQLYFNGNAVPLKYIVGVDWEREEAYFNKLPYTETPEKPGNDSIIISVPVARELGARQGDSVILETVTVTKQKNTGIFYVAGIVENSNFFSYYKIFIPRTALNRLSGFAEDDGSMIGFYLKNRSQIEARRTALYNELASRISLGPLVYERDMYDQETRKVDNGISVFLLTLQVYLSEVAQMMNAIDLASYVLYVMMLAIIMVSAGVTCRLILHERTRETGTMRAIGFYETDVRLIFKLEIFVMVLFAMAAGFALAVFINQILSLSSFSWFPGFEVFMKNGRLDALYLPGTTAFNILATLCMLGLSIQRPIFRNSRNPLPEMLSGGAI